MSTSEYTLMNKILLSQVGCLTAMPHSQLLLNHCQLLAWVRHTCTEPYSNVSACPVLLQSLMDPTKGFKVSAVEGDAFTTAIGRLFGFAYVWALGGNLAPSCTEAFDEFVREHLQDVVTFPGEPQRC